MIKSNGGSGYVSNVYVHFQEFDPLLELITVSGNS
jgi:hypothetical protein